MTNEQNPASQPQPYSAPRGPEFGGPGYETELPYEPEPAPVPSPSPAPVAPYEPPPAGPAPVVHPGTPSYGYGQQPPPGYHPAAYYPPGYGYMMQPEHPSSTSVLVMGILGIFLGIPAPIAWITGHKAKKQIAQGAPYRFTAVGQTGYVLGITFTVLYGLFWGLIFLAMIVA